MPDQESGGNPLITFLELLLLALLFLIASYILTTFYNVFPANPTLIMLKSVYIDFFGFLDKTFLFLTFFLLFVDLYKVYKSPSVAKGIGNILFILAFGFIFLTVRTAVVSALIPLQFATILPSTFATVTSNYIGAFVFFMLIICTALCFRKPTASTTTETPQINY